MPMEAVAAPKVIAAVVVAPMPVKADLEPFHGPDAGHYPCRVLVDRR